MGLRPGRRTARAASFRTAGTTTFPTTPFRRTAGAIATFTAAASVVRATSAAIAEMLTAGIHEPLALVIAKLAVFVFIETLKHPLVHLFTIGTTFVSRRRFVGLVSLASSSALATLASDANINARAHRSIFMVHLAWIYRSLLLFLRPARVVAAKTINSTAKRRFRGESKSFSGSQPLDRKLTARHSERSEG